MGGEERCEERSDGAGMFVAEKWVDNVLLLKAQLKSTDFEDGLRQWFIECSYCLYSSLRETGGGKERFWNEVFHLVSCTPQNEMVVLAGDMNGHVGSSVVGYDGTHGGFQYEGKNADGSRILEFAAGLNLVICSTLFMKQESR